jgi:transcription antitermination factor NusG
MARHDWIALVCDPAAEYTAWVDLERFGLSPYLPQLRKRWIHPHLRTPLMKRYPLFPRYLLLPIRDADQPAIRICRGLRRIRPILSNAEGRPWRAPDAVIQAVREVEARGELDEVIQAGDKIRLTSAVLEGVQGVLTKSAVSGNVQVLLALFGGVKASVPQAGIARI